MTDQHPHRYPRRDLLGAVVRRMRAAYERVDAPGLLATLSLDLEFRDPTFQLHANGLAEMKKIIDHGAAEIASVRIVVEHELACGPWIIAQQEQQVTFKTRSSPVAVRGVSLFRVEDGLIREWHDYYDALGMQRQLKPAAAVR